MTEIICKICNKKSTLKSYGACQKCVNRTPEARANKYKWKKNNPDKYKKSEQLRKQKPHNKLKAKILRKKYYNSHKEQEKYQHKIWELNNKDKRKLISHRRRSKKLNIIHSFTTDEWNEMIEATDGICLSCKGKVGKDKLTLDHIIPISKAKPGTVYTIKDIQPLCSSCNSSKKDKL